MHIPVSDFKFEYLGRAVQCSGKVRAVSELDAARRIVGGNSHCVRLVYRGRYDGENPDLARIRPGFRACIAVGLSDSLDSVMQVFCVSEEDGRSC